jgi:hypothetical protein
VNEKLESDPVEEDKHGGNGENENQMKTVVTKGALRRRKQVFSEC